MARMDDSTLLSILTHDIDTSTGKSYEELNNDRAGHSSIISVNPTVTKSKDAVPSSPRR